MWSLKAFKPPGPDGLHAGFFQRFWLVVGRSVIDEVQKIFVERKVPSYLNNTHIAVIPKIQRPETLRNYRPISLCNTVYKIVTKVIVARLRPFLDKLISPVQAAFVLGRKGLDNTIIVQETIHSITKKRGEVGYMALKIDLEKAYDKLEWSLIKDMLVRANIPDDLIVIIMSCISSVSTSILVNGEALDSIYPSRGIRQGDLLSPYLFILCMDYLGQLIEEKCHIQLWQPVKASQSGPAFSHLFFADDLVLFAKADYINCSAIRDVLDDFCSLFGQTISEAKSKVLFSPNVDRDTRKSLCNILGFASTPNLGKYLGFPIKHVRSSSQDYNFILDRVKQKLARWKANLLSLAGRAVLIQASTAAIPSYVMQCTHLPIKILEGLDWVNRNFLWGSSENVRKIHWVGWKNVTKPKDEDGLGLQIAKGRNVALLGKLNWSFNVERDAPWAKVLRAKYCNSRRSASPNADRLPCSHIWAAMKKGREVFNAGSMWMVGRESKLSFWYGNWSKKGPLRHLIQGPLNCEESKWEVKDLMTDMGWNLDQISFVLLLEVKLMIQATPIPLTGRGRDSLAWKDNPRGIFDLRSAYSLVNGTALGLTFSAKWIWKANTLPRIKTFMWQCAHNSLGVKGCLTRRGMGIDDTCPFCQEGVETVLHALRDCSWVRLIWRQLGVLPSNQDFWGLDLQDWLVYNGLWKPNGAVGSLPWKMVFPFALWNIWKSRNGYVFRGKIPNPKLAEEIVNQGMEFLYCVDSPRDLTCSIIKRVRWENHK